MTADVFVDTNVFLYAIDEDAVSTPKRELARALLLTERWGWSVQIASEFFVNATSARRPFRLTVDDATAFVETWLAYPIAPVTADTVRKAIALYQRFSLSYWDACVLAAAIELGCHTVFSEDMQHGQQYDDVRVVNPFESLSPASAT